MGTSTPKGFATAVPAAMTTHSPSDPKSVARTCEGAPPTVTKRFATTTSSPCALRATATREGPSPHDERHQEQRERSPDHGRVERIHSDRRWDRGEREARVTDERRHDDGPTGLHLHRQAYAASQRITRTASTGQVPHGQQCETIGERVEREVDSTRGRAAKPRRARSAASPSRRSSASASACTSRGSTTYPSHRRQPPPQHPHWHRRSLGSRTRRPRGTRCRSPRPRARPTARGTASRRRRRSRRASAARRRSPGPGGAPEDRARLRAREAVRVRPPPAITMWTPSSVATASRSTSNPFRGTSRLTPTRAEPRNRDRSDAAHHRARPRRAGGSGRRPRREAPRASAADARDVDGRSRPNCPPATTPATPCNTRRPSRPLYGRRPNTVTSAPCAITTYGAESGAARSARAGTSDPGTRRSPRHRVPACRREYPTYASATGIARERALDPELLFLVPRARSWERSRENRRVRRGQPTPELVEIGLDPPHLWWKVVRREQGRHGPGCSATNAPSSSSTVPVFVYREPERSSTRPRTAASAPAPNAP